MTSHSYAKLDQWISEYLLFRGFIISAKHIEAEAKVAKDKSYRVDKIVGQLQTFVGASDLVSLLDYWRFMSQHVFSSLQEPHSSCIHTIEINLYKLYLVQCIQNNRGDKVNEFFDKMCSHLHKKAEWAGWFELPYIKQPETNKNFQVYFTRLWQDTFYISLYNFITNIFAKLPIPSLITQREDLKLIEILREQNRSLRTQLANQNQESQRHTRVESLSEIKDDFSILMQKDSKAMNMTSNLKALIKNISLPSSPTYQISSNPEKSGKADSEMKRTSSSSSAPKSRSPDDIVSQRKSSTTGTYRRGSESKDVKCTVTPPSDEGIKTSILRNTKYNFDTLKLLNQKEYKEHKCAIHDCKFSPNNRLVASLDTNGILKIWDKMSFTTLMSNRSEHKYLCFTWIDDVSIMVGTIQGTIKKLSLSVDACSSKEKLVVNIQNCRILTLTVDSTANILCCSSSLIDTLMYEKWDGLITLSIWNCKSMTKLTVLNNSSDYRASVMCSHFSDSSKFLAAGCANGTIKVYDLHTSSCVCMWHAHSNGVFTIRYHGDNVISTGSDNRFIIWSQSGTILHDFGLFSGKTSNILDDPFYANSRDLFTVYDDLAFVCRGQHVRVYQCRDDHECKQVVNNQPSLVCIDTGATCCVVGTESGSLLLYSLTY